MRVGEALRALRRSGGGVRGRVDPRGAAPAVAAWVLGLDLEVAWRVLAGLRNCHWGGREGRAGWRLQTWNASSGVASRTGSPPP